MDNAPVEKEHSSFKDVLKIQKKKNGKRTTRVIYVAHCKCGFSTHKRMARVKRVKGKWTRDSITCMNEVKKKVNREYLLHLNGKYEPG